MQGLGVESGGNWFLELCVNKYQYVEFARRDVSIRVGWFVFCSRLSPLKKGTMVFHLASFKESDSNLHCTSLSRIILYYISFAQIFISVGEVNG